MLPLQLKDEQVRKIKSNQKSTSTVDSQLVVGTMGSGTKELYRSLTDATEDSEFAVRPGIAGRGRGLKDPGSLVVALNLT